MDTEQIITSLDPFDAEARVKRALEILDSIENRPGSRPNWEWVRNTLSAALRGEEPGFGSDLEPDDEEFNLNVKTMALCAGDDVAITISGHVYRVTFISGGMAYALLYGVPEQLCIEAMAYIRRGGTVYHVEHVSGITFKVVG